MLFLQSSVVFVVCMHLPQTNLRLEENLSIDLFCFSFFVQIHSFGHISNPDHGVYVCEHATNTLWLNFKFV